MKKYLKYFVVIISAAVALLTLHIYLTGYVYLTRERAHAQSRESKERAGLMTHIVNASSRSSYDWTSIFKGIKDVLGERYDNKGFSQSLSGFNNPTVKMKKETFQTFDRKVSKVNCAKIIAGDKRELNKSKELLKNYKKDIITLEDYINMTKNCAFFRQRRGYITSPVTKLEEDFPIAFSILMFKDVGQVERLLRAMYRPQNIYCVHYDKKSSTEVKAVMTLIASCFENVFIASRAVDVQWGYYSVLEPEIVCMEDLWKRSKKWKYFINLTGQEFPIRTNYELVRILMAYNGANDIEGTRKYANRDRWAKAGPPPHNITLTKGAIHIVANRDFVDYALHNQTAIDFLKWSKNTMHPDETFFSTLNHNPQLRIKGSYKGVPETDMVTKPFLARFKTWISGMFRRPCFGQFVRDVCVFGVGDLPLLTKSEAPFANKFYWDYQPFTLDCMEEWHFNRTRDGVPETDMVTKPFLARFKTWISGMFRRPCFGQFVRDVCVFGVGDLPLLTKSEAPFANKFYWDYQPSALDCME